MKLSMLRSATVFSVSFATLFISLAQAGPQGRHRQTGVLDQNEEERYVMVTGSNLPQKVKLKSIGTTTPYNIRIYTQRELLSSGRSTVGGALSSLDPSISVGH